MSVLHKNATDFVRELLHGAFTASQLENYSRLLEELEKPPEWQTWGVGLTIVTACSFSAPLGMLVVPCLSKQLYERVMTFLVALGIGALSGSTLFIMIPQAYHITELDIGYVDKSWIIISALYGFFTVDRMLQYIIEIRKRRQAKRKVHASTIESIMHDGTKARQATEQTDLPGDDELADRERERERNELKNELEIAIVNNALTRTFSTRRRMAVVNAVDGIEYKEHDNPHSHSSHNHHHLPDCKCTDGEFLHEINQDIGSKITPCAPDEASDLPVHYVHKPKLDDEVSVSVQVVEKRVLEPAKLEVASVAYMIIFGSSANNFVDGMSTGAAFSDSILRGLSIGISIISQQFPQELGTLAILVKSGLGVKRALLFNLIPIVLSYLGFIVGVLLDNIDEGYDDIIFSISSGMYLYISLGTLIPEIRDSTNELIKQDLRESALVSVLQFVGIAFGLGFIFVMSSYAQQMENALI